MKVLVINTELLANQFSTVPHISIFFQPLLTSLFSSGIHFPFSSNHYLFLLFILPPLVLVADEACRGVSFCRTPGTVVGPSSILSGKIPQNYERKLSVWRNIVWPNTRLCMYMARRTNQMQFVPEDIWEKLGYRYAPASSIWFLYFTLANVWDSDLFLDDGIDRVVRHCVSYLQQVYIFNSKKKLLKYIWSEKRCGHIFHIT